MTTTTTTVMEPIPGLDIKKPGVTNKTICDMMDVIRSERAMSLNERRLRFRIQDPETTTNKRIAVLRKMKKAVRDLEKCAVLEETFSLVELNKRLTRNITVPNSSVKIPIPLIWGCDVPVKKAVQELVIKMGKDSYQRDIQYNVRVLVPVPPPECLALYREYKKKFDFMEMWWVPNDCLVREVPRPVIEPVKYPDPILIGVRRVEGLVNRYFSVYRWIDTAYEDGWWAREAY